VAAAAKARPMSVNSTEKEVLPVGAVVRAGATAGAIAVETGDTSFLSQNWSTALQIGSAGL
jgi:hypothetical protein